MPLVRCPDCGAEVSDAAPACPRCGRPLAAQTVERTGKRVKRQMGLGCLVFALAGAALGVALSDSAGGIADEAGVVAAVLLLIGLIVWGRARFQQWWHHE